MADIIITERGVLVPIERWRALTETMLETAGKAAIAAEFMIERCDAFDGDCDLEDDDPDHEHDGSEVDEPDHEHDGCEPEEGY